MKQICLILVLLSVFLSCSLFKRGVIPDENLAALNLENLKNLKWLAIQENPIQDKTAIRRLRKLIPHLQILESNH